MEQALGTPVLAARGTGRQSSSSPDPLKPPRSSKLGSARRNRAAGNTRPRSERAARHAAQQVEFLVQVFSENTEKAQPSQTGRAKPCATRRLFAARRRPRGADAP